MPVTNYFTLGGQMVGEKTTGQSRLDYVVDALGSVVATVDQTLITQYTGRYKPYGDVLNSTGTQPNFTWVGNLGYLKGAGGPHSQYSVRERIYSSSEGAWTSVDPLWPTAKCYAYADSSPVVSTDPSVMLPPCLKCVPKDPVYKGVEAVEACQQPPGNGHQNWYAESYFWCKQYKCKHGSYYIIVREARVDCAKDSVSFSCPKNTCEPPKKTKGS